MAKRPAKAKAPAAEAPKKTSTRPAKEPTSAVGRGPNPENQARLDHILARTKEEPGVESRTLAAELDITTLQCSQLTDRLVRSGDLEIFKLASGVRTNYLPKDLNKVRAKLEKQREADIADREANAATSNKEKFAKLKEQAAAKKAAGKKTATGKDSEKSAPTPRRRRAKADA